ncbi:MAG: pimeloyl-ACP methyl ester carboxylesterase [Flavobacteriaceae bacterium]|jgi:pimeloyl-ACP methyl ester carboxylesterase|uniref:alpha/beta fold hydrolase n=1 Tax=Candidatus Marifrigoribacter sp. Uisw_064 TaxID=3230970 RepID=UPI003ADFEA3A
MGSKTKYTKIGDFNIAYQVIGEGPIDILYIPGWVSNIDMMWTEPRLAAFLTRLSLFSRLIIFDKRDTGLSDRSDEYSIMEVGFKDIEFKLQSITLRGILYMPKQISEKSLVIAINHDFTTTINSKKFLFTSNFQV